LRLQWIVLWAACALAIVACSRQEAGWRDARRADSVTAYQVYLEHFPAGAHSGEARARIRELQEEREWARASQLMTPEGWQHYLGAFPDGRYAAVARKQLSAFVLGRVPPGESRFVIQLGAYSSEAAAGSDLARLSRDHGDLLGPLKPQIQAPTAGAPLLWRLRTAPLPETAARSICADLQSRSVVCVPVAE
jgi:hypothetical protein